MGGHVGPSGPIDNQGGDAAPGNLSGGGEGDDNLAKDGADVDSGGDPPNIDLGGDGADLNLNGG